MIATQHIRTQLFPEDIKPGNRRKACVLSSAEQPQNFSIKRRMMNDPGISTTNSTMPDHIDEDRHIVLAPQAIREGPFSDEDTTPVESLEGSRGSRTSSHGSTWRSNIDHIIELSSIEHCMPRAYIRICLAYRVPSAKHLDDAIEGLRRYVKSIVKAKPYLAGNVTDVKTPERECGRAEIRFTTSDYLNQPEVIVNHLVNSDDSPITYDELDRAGLPPSRLIPQEVSTLLENVNPEDESPVFRVQANLVEGGLIVSIYLHHCVSDGTGFDLITSGDLLKDQYTFSWGSPEGEAGVIHLEDKLTRFVQQKSAIRHRLSTAAPSTSNTRQIRARRRDGLPRPHNKPGRGCVIMLSSKQISLHQEAFNNEKSDNDPTHHTVNSVMMALLWRHMTRARRASVAHNEDVTSSKLLIPVNIRDKVEPPLPDGYFGSAIDSGKAELDLDSLTDSTAMSLCDISKLIRQAVDAVDDAYVREMIAFANHADALTDVHDIQASNMDRVNGADMYITSWLAQKTYAHDLGMGLGGPDWVRKPWSRDPGSCIILPRKMGDPEYYEVVVQMTEPDMCRLLEDKEFLLFVLRVID